MADYSNIQRVVIRKAVEILRKLNQQIDVIRIMAERQVIPKIITDHMMMQIDLKIEEAALLAGFANADDMKYFTTHFMNL